jgi:ribosomal protein S18 acetylase RimI-like enzyme
VIQRVDPADPDTAAALVVLQRAAYAVEAALIGADVIPAMRETPAALAASGLTFLAVRPSPDGHAAAPGDAEADAPPDDAAAAPPVPFLAALAYERRGDVVDIHRLVVDPGAFRRGHASRLIDAVLEREADASRAVVATALANAPALRLYERHGFHRAGERVVAGGVQIVELERVLRSPR